MQKKLFVDPVVDPEDSVEIDLVYNQLVSDVFACRIPVSTETLVSLCALIAQAEYGDASDEHANVLCDAASDENNGCDYLSTMRIVPREMRDKVSIEAIEICHRELVGVTVLRSKLKSIELLKTWPLFGSKLFIVTVSQLCLFLKFSVN